MRGASGKAGGARRVVAAKPQVASGRVAGRRGVARTGVDGKGAGRPTEAEALVAAIGARLRAIRLRQKITLLQLARETGLSSSMLSLMERGKAAPSIGTLVAVGTALGVPTAELMLGAAPPGPSEPVARLGDQLVFATPEGVRRRVLRTDAARAIEISMVEYTPGTASHPHPTTHGGYEFGVVIAGTLEVTVNGEAFKLGAGDLVSYNSTDPHRIANRSRRAARALWVNLRRC